MSLVGRNTAIKIWGINTANKDTNGTSIASNAGAIHQPQQLNIVIYQFHQMEI